MTLGSGNEAQFIRGVHPSFSFRHQWLKKQKKTLKINQRLNDFKYSGLFRKRNHFNKRDHCS